MGAAAVVGYGLVSVLRAHRRSVLILIALALAIATIATPAVALDSEVRALVAQYAASIPYDYHALGRTAEFDNLTAAVASLDGIVGAEPIALPVVASSSAVVRNANGSGLNRTPIDFAFVRPSFARFSDRFGLTGSLDLAPLRVAVADRLASHLGLGPGDPIELMNIATVCTERPFECNNVTRTANYTIDAVLATPVTSSSPYVSLPVGSLVRSDVVLASLDDLAAFRDELSLGFDTPPRIAILAWADRARLIDPYSADTTATRVLHLEREIAAAVARWAFAVGVAASAETGASLPDVVRQVDDATGLQRGLFVLFSLPAASLGYLFSRMGFEASLGRRRREIGVLRSRGFSIRQIVAHLLVEAALLGTFAGFLGVLIAILVSRAFLGVVNASFAGGVAIPFSDVSVSASSLAISIGAGIGLAFLGAYPAVRRAATLRIVRALHTVSVAETAVDYRQARSFLSIVVGASGLLLILGFQGVTTQAGLLTFLFGAALAVLILLAPILLIVGLARFVTVGTDRPYRALSILVARWTGQLHFLVAEGLRRNPRRSSTLAILVAFSLAFAVFVVSLVGVVEASEVRVARTAVGGDLYVDARNVDRADMEGIGSDPAVAAVAVVDFIPSDIGVIVAVNGTSYLDAVPSVDDYYFLEGSAAALRGFGSGGSSLVNADLAHALALHAGDPIVLRILAGRTQYVVVLRIVGIVRALPGLQPAGTATDATRTIFTDLRTLWAQNVTIYPSAAPGRRAIVRTTAGTDPHALAASLEDRWAGHAIVLEDLLTGQRGDPFRASLFGHLYTQAGLAVFIMVLAVTLTAFATAVEREGEFATLVARGLDRPGLVALLFGEGMTVGLLGALLAVPVAVVFLWDFLRLYESARPNQLPLEFVLPAAVVYFLLAALAAVGIGTLLAGLRLGRLNLPRVLKLRGM